MATPSRTLSRSQENSESLVYLRALERKVLWIASWMIHHANHDRPSRDGLKVGGHQASCASVATLMTALYFHVLRPNDRRRREAPRKPDLSRDSISLWSSDSGASDAFSCPERCAGVSLPDQRCSRRGFLDGVGWSRRCHDVLRGTRAGLSSVERTGEQRSARADGCAGRRRRVRRRERVRGAVRVVETRCQKRLVGRRLQPPESRFRGGRSIF